MNAKPVPLPSPEDMVTQRLVVAVESAIGVIQERLINLAPDSQDVKQSVADLIRLLQLRNQLLIERPAQYAPAGSMPHPPPANPFRLNEASGTTTTTNDRPSPEIRVRHGNKEAQK